MRCKPAGYGVIRLNVQSDTAWAVIERPSGAIAMGADGRLLMRLGKSEAADIAAALALALLKPTDALDGGTPSAPPAEEAI